MGSRIRRADCGTRLKIFCRSRRGSSPRPEAWNLVRTRRYRIRNSCFRGPFMCIRLYQEDLASLTRTYPTSVRDVAQGSRFGHAVGGSSSSQLNEFGHTETNLHCPLHIKSLTRSIYKQFWPLGRNPRSNGRVSVDSARISFVYARRDSGMSSGTGPGKS